METTSVPFSNLEIRFEDDRHYIEGICVPWGQRTDRVAIPEVFDRGAFADLVSTNATIKLTDYNHSRSRVPVGRSSVFEDRTEGLWARFKLNNTPEGRGAHDNVLEGVYGGLSIGFVARGERMIDGVRHVTSARLDHVSLVEEPAYEEALILDVRAALDADIAEWRAIAAPRTTTLDLRPREVQSVLMSKLHR